MDKLEYVATLAAEMLMAAIIGFLLGIILGYGFLKVVGL